MVLIYTTCKDTTEAVKLGNLLIQQKLAACVNIWPIQSMYMDSGSLKSHTEAVLIVKTLEPKVAHVEELIEKHHTYSTPFIGSLSVHRLNHAYREWMTAQMH